MPKTWSRWPDGQLYTIYTQERIYTVPQRLDIFTLRVTYLKPSLVASLPYLRYRELSLSAA